MYNLYQNKRSDIQFRYKVRSTGTPSYLSRHIKPKIHHTCTSPSLFIAPATTKTHHQDTIRRSRFSLHCTCCLEISEQLHCIVAHSLCLSQDSRHSYSVGLFTLFSSHDCSCPLAPRKSFDILALYKSDYYYYYYYSVSSSTL